MTNPIRGVSQAGLTTILGKFDIQKQGAKDQAISTRISQLFEMHKPEIILFAIATLPLLPIAWPIGYAVLRAAAEKDIVDAVAEKRMDLIKKSAQGMEGGQVPPEFRKFFKESHLEMLRNIGGEFIGTTDSWSTYKSKLKKTSRSLVKQMGSLKAALMKKYRLSDTQLFAWVVKFNGGKRPSNLKELINILKNLEEGDRAIESIIRSAEKEIKATAINDYCIPPIRTAILGDSKEDDNGAEIVVFEITDQKLPIYQVTLRDAFNCLVPSAFLVFNEDDVSSIYTAPRYVDLREDQLGTEIREDANHEKLKSLTEKTLFPIIKLYNDIVAKNSLLTEQDKLKLWRTLQLSLTQGIISHLWGPIKNELTSRLGQEGYKCIKEDSYLEYAYNSAENTLDIVYSVRQSIAKEGEYSTIFQINSEVTMRIDLKSFEPTIDIKINPQPISKEHLLDTLPELKTLKTTEELDAYLKDFKKITAPNS